MTLIFLAGCEDDVEPSLNENTNLLVVDGWIYNTPGPHTIKVSRSVPFENIQNLEPVTNAQVIIRNNRLEEHRLEETTTGTYQTIDGYSGEVNLFYQVEIILRNGAVYQSDFERLHPVPEIISLTMDEFINENDPNLTTFQFFPVALVQEFEEPGDFYRWKIARDEVFFDEAEDILLQTDRFINGNLFRNEFKEYLFKEEEQVEVRLESITQEAYNFLRFFRRQTTDLGTSGGTNPGTLRGNLKNRDDDNEVVLGYFGASAVSSAKLTVGE